MEHYRARLIKQITMNDSSPNPILSHVKSTVQVFSDLAC